MKILSLTMAAGLLIGSAAYAQRPYQAPTPDEIGKMTKNIQTKAELEQATQQSQAGKQMIERVMYHWDNNTNDWGDTAKLIEVSYKSNGSPDEIIVWEYSFGGTVNSREVHSDFVFGANPRDEDVFLPGWVPKLIEHQSLMSGSWVTVAKDLLEYDKGIPVKSELQVTSGPGTFVPQYKQEYLHDAKGNYYGTQNWDYTGGNWQMSDGVRYTYTYSGTKISSAILEEYDLSNQSWYKYKKEEYYYDATGKASSVVLYNTDQVNWQESDSFVVTWNTFKGTRSIGDSEGPFILGGNDLKSYLDYGYDISSNDWSLSQRATQTFDAKKRPTQVLIEDNAGTDKWDNNSRYVWEYYPNGYLKSNVYSIWDGSTWKELEVYEFTSTFTSNNDPIAIEEKAWYNNNLMYGVKNVYDYNSINSSITNSDNTGITAIYPNPASDIVNITLDKVNANVTINITDISGKQVHGMNATQTNSIRMDVSGLAKGTYIVNVISDEGRSYSRLVRQ